MLDILFIIFSVIALVFSVVIHEVAHGAVASSLGDPTAKFAGRLTLNPFSHLDPIGSFLLPLSLFLLTNGAIVFGYAKPVPINPFNFRDQKFGQAKVAAAGVAANFALALVFGLLLRGLQAASIPAGPDFYLLAQEVVLINLVLAVFNLIPIPPLDGSHILFTFLPRSQEDFKIFLQRYGFIFLIFFMVFLLNQLTPIIQFLYQLITGMPLQ